MSDTPPTSKACTKCGVVKPLGEFHKRSKVKSGLRFQCKKCDAADSAKWRAKNPEKNKARVSEWLAKNPEKKKASSKKSIAKRINELLPSYCVVKLGIPVSQVTPELIELKRTQLTLLRATNQLKKEMKNVE